MNYLKTVWRGSGNTTNELCPVKAPVDEGGVASVEEEEFSHYLVQVLIDPDTVAKGRNLQKLTNRSLACIHSLAQPWWISGGSQGNEWTPRGDSAVQGTLTKGLGRFRERHERGKGP